MGMTLAYILMIYFLGLGLVEPFSTESGRVRKERQTPRWATCLSSSPESLDDDKHILSTTDEPDNTINNVSGDENDALYFSNLSDTLDQVFYSYA